MKTIKYIFRTATMAVCAAAVSCSFLDEVNHTTQTAEEYYKTKEGYESLVISCYNDLKDTYNTNLYMMFAQLGTDLFTQNYPLTVVPMNQYTDNYQPDNGTIYQMWTQFYRTLKNTNAAIDRAKSVILIDQDQDGMSPNVLEQRVAEVKALRALHLFEIVRNWGYAPLMNYEPLEPEYSATYADPADFYDQILADLTDAIAVLPARQEGTNYGRASASMAKHLRALVYLTRGYESFAQPNDFQNAFNDAEDVYLNSGHTLQNDYGMVHRQSNETNAEIIFCIGYANSAGYNNNKWNQWYIFPFSQGGWLGLGKDAGYGNTTTYTEAIPTKFAYLMYDWQKDLRAQVNYMSPYNGNTATSVDGRNLGLNKFKCTAPVSGIFAVGDVVIHYPLPVEGDYKQWTDAEKDLVDYAVYNFPNGDADDWSDDDYYRAGYQTTNSLSRSALPIWKFKDANAIYNEDQSGSGTRDIFVFRLAETCLIAAEAAVNMSDDANARKYINYVVERAARNAPQAGLTLYSGTVTIDDVLDERARELLAEVPRWNDLQRTGKLAERVLKYNWDVNNVTGGVIETTLTEESFRSKFKYRPIPLIWLNSLSNGQELGNNPGW